MGLTIDFECPECRSIIARKLTELAPGRIFRCSECGERPILTETALKGLEIRLDEYCRR